MLYLVWLPADPVAAAALVPNDLTPADGSPVCYPGGEGTLGSLHGR